MSLPFDLVVVGQVSLDRISNGWLAEDQLGGGATYVAAVAAALGCQVGLVSRVGPDFGPSNWARLRQLGIDISAVTKSETPTTRIELDYVYQSLRAFRVLQGAADELSPRDLPLRWRSAALIHLAPAPIDALISIADRLRHHCGSVSYAPHADLRSLGLERAKPIFHRADVVFLNKEELRDLTGMQSIDEGARRVQSCGPPVVVVTRGVRGSVVFDRNTMHRQRSYPTEPFVDAVGAGDAFAAGFLFGRSRGLPLAACAAVGSACGALMTRCVGLTCLVRKDEVLSLIRQFEPHHISAVRDALAVV